MAKKEGGGGLSLEMSDRDKKLVIILLIILMVGAAYYYGYRGLSEKALEQKKEFNRLKEVQADLEEKERNIDSYESDILLYEKDYAALLGSFGSGITQTSQIDFLNKVERVTDAWIKSVSFSAAVPVYTFSNASDMQGYKTSLTLAYEAKYDDWKKLIKFLNTYFSKNVIENISMAYSEITGEVSGSISLALYTVSGGDRLYSEPEFEVGTGTENIFISDSLGVAPDKGDKGEYILANYDYYLAISPYTAVVDTYIMGRRNALANGLLSIKSAEPQTVSISVSGKEGNYRIDYQLGDKVRGEDYKDAGGSLDLLVISSARVSDDDNAQVELSITNTSDIPVNIKLYNDDANSRVNVKSTEGNVVIY